MQTTLERGWKMRKVKAKTADLLTAIKANYEAHKVAYAEAFDGYKEEAAEAIAAKKVAYRAAAEALAARVAAADRSRGEKPVSLILGSDLISFGKRPPESHASDYEVVIRMLEFEQSEVIEVEQDQFESYVMDRWGWKDDFLAMHTAYGNKGGGPRASK